MHLSHVGIYWATFLSPTDASLTVRVVRNMPDSLSPPKHPLWWASKSTQGPSQGCRDMRSSLVSTWLVWLLHTTAFNSAWANLSQGEDLSEQHFITSTQRPFTGCCCQVDLPSLPPGRVTKPSPGGRWLSMGKTPHSLCLPFPRCGGTGVMLITACHGGKCERGRGFWEMAPEGHYPRGRPTLGTGDPSSTTGGIWPGCRKGLSGLSDPSVEGLAELCVFALQNLLWVSVLHLQEACALCK